MAFTVDLYSINVRSDAANKLAGAVREQSITTDLPRVITSNGCTVQYDQFINCNYARYEFNGLTWVCDVEIETVGNSIVNYILTVDPLSTAYYNGCFNSSQYITRCGSGGTYAALNLRDPMINTEQILNVLHGEIDTISNPDSYIINTALPASTTLSAYFSECPTYIASYLMSSAQVASLMNEIYTMESQVDRNSIMASFLPCYAVFSGRIPSYFDYNKNNIYLPFITSYTLQDNVPTYFAFQTNCRALRIKQYNNDVFIHKSVVANFKGDSLTYGKAIANIDVSNVGSFSVPLAEYGIKDVETIGYAYTFDSISGLQKAYPYINGTIIKDISATSVIGTNFPLYFDTQVADWSQSLLTAVTGIAGAGLAIGFGAATGGAGAALAPAALAGASTLFSNEITQGQSRTTVSGGAGYSPDLTSKKNSSYNILYPSYIHEGDVHSKYGYLKLAYDNLNSYTGYIQTSNCALPHNGLPRSVIDSANSLLDAGIWVL